MILVKFNSCINHILQLVQSIFGNKQRSFYDLGKCETAPTDLEEFKFVQKIAFSVSETLTKHHANLINFFCSSLGKMKSMNHITENYSFRSKFI